jgi:hypothetical protein
MVRAGTRLERSMIRMSSPVPSWGGGWLGSERHRRRPLRRSNPPSARRTLTVPVPRFPPSAVCVRRSSVYAALSSWPASANVHAGVGSTRCSSRKLLRSCLTASGTSRPLADASFRIIAAGRAAGRVLGPGVALIQKRTLGIWPIHRPQARRRCPHLDVERRLPPHRYGGHLRPALERQHSTATTVSGAARTTRGRERTRPNKRRGECRQAGGEAAAVGFSACVDRTPPNGTSVAGGEGGSSKSGNTSSMLSNHASIVEFRRTSRLTFDLD